MPKSTRAKFRARFLTKMNDKKRKDPIYITATCKAREKGMVGEERLKRMVEAQSLADALGVLRESAFGSGETVEGNASGYDYESFITPKLRLSATRSGLTKANTLLPRASSLLNRLSRS